MTIRFPRSAPKAFVTSAALVALALPASAFAAPASQPVVHEMATHGTLTQLPKARGCLVDRSAPVRGCGTARALKGAGPFMGSRAIALSPDGKNVYVASSGSDAVAVFRRNRRSGGLAQPGGSKGCVAAKGADGCATGAGLNGPNSVAVSPDGRNVYATSRGSNAIAIFRRDRSTGALTQLPASTGCISGLPAPVCASGRALVAPDVVVVSPDGKNVYVGSFFGNAVAVFDRDPKTGALTQPTGTAGCIAEATSGCALGLALEAPEGLAISGDGDSVYVATALSNAVVVLARDPSSGALTQPSGGGGCIVDSTLTGCTTGVELSGANAVTAALMTRVCMRPRCSATVSPRSPARPRPMALRRSPVPPAAWSGCARLAARSAARSARPRGSPSHLTGQTSMPLRLPRARLLCSTEAGNRVWWRRSRAAPVASLLTPFRAARAPGRWRASARSHSVPTATISTRPRSAATPSTSSGGTNESKRQA